MIRDILVPYRIGAYYLFSKRILSFNVTPVMVQGLLIEYKGHNIQIKNNLVISLKDFSVQSQVSAIKKIASTIGSYDDVVTSLSSSIVAFKELQLPFLGRDKLEMIVAFEVESLLPFSVDESVIDFMVTTEDLEKKISTVLVAAARKEDIDLHVGLFEKAEISLSTMTVDLFSLYKLYFWGIYSTTVDSVALPSKVSTSLKPVLLLTSGLLQSQGFFGKIRSFLGKKQVEKKDLELKVSTLIVTTVKRAELLVDIGFDVTRILYMQDGVLKLVRIVPFGVSDLAQSIVRETGIAYYDIAHSLMLSSELSAPENIVTAELKKIFDEALKTLGFFEKQENINYVTPNTIWFSGLSCNLVRFKEEAQQYFNSTVCFVDVQKVLKQLRIKESSKEKLTITSFFNLSVGIFTYYDYNINFLKSFARDVDNRLLRKQILTMFAFTVLCIGGSAWISINILSDFNLSYLSSKKQLTQAIEQRMNLDLKAEKSVKTIVEKTEEYLKKEKALWFSFSRQTEKSMLEYLQDLSVHIDRESIGLDLRHMHIDYEKATLTGTVKSIEVVEIFEEELMELQYFTLVERPRETSFSVHLKAKEDQEVLS